MPLICSSYLFLSGRDSPQNHPLHHHGTLMSCKALLMPSLSVTRNRSLEFRFFLFFMEVPVKLTMVFPPSALLHTTQNVNLTADITEGVILPTFWNWARKCIILTVITFYQSPVVPSNSSSRSSLVSVSLKQLFLHIPFIPPPKRVSWEWMFPSWKLPSAPASSLSSYYPPKM